MPDGVRKRGDRRTVGVPRAFFRCETYFVLFVCRDFITDFYLMIVVPGDLVEKKKG